MYQKQILMEKLKEATASVLPISLIVMAISFVLVPVDAGLMLSFVIATAMLILGMGLFTLGADMSMSRIGNYMGSKLTKSRKLPLILTVSFALGVAITVAEPDLQVLAGNVPEIDTTVLILTVSVGVGFFLMLCIFTERDTVFKSKPLYTCSQKLFHASATAKLLTDIMTQCTDIRSL